MTMYCPLPSSPRLMPEYRSPTAIPAQTRSASPNRPTKIMRRSTPSRTGCGNDHYAARRMPPQTANPAKSPRHCPLQSQAIDARRMPFANHPRTSARMPIAHCHASSKGAAARSSSSPPPQSKSAIRKATSSLAKTEPARQRRSSAPKPQSVSGSGPRQPPQPRQSIRVHAPASRTSMQTTPETETDD